LRRPKASDDSAFSFTINSHELCKPNVVKVKIRISDLGVLITSNPTQLPKMV